MSAFHQLSAGRSGDGPGSGPPCVGPWASPTAASVSSANGTTARTPARRGNRQRSGDRGTPARRVAALESVAEENRADEPERRVAGVAWEDLLPVRIAQPP